MDKKTIANSELRIVRGNAFNIKIQVEAIRLDGTEVENFNLSEAAPQLKVWHAGEKTEKAFVIDGNAAIISFAGTEPLGWYGLEMTGTFDGAAWRFAVVQVFQIVETNEKANVPAWTFLTDDTYFVEGVLTIASAADAVQADWNETNPQSASYIKNKPTVVSPAQLQQSVNAEKERAEAAEQANAAAIAEKYTKPSDGIPSTDMTEAVQTSLQKAENAAPQATTYTKEQVDAMIADFITRSVNDLLNYYLKSETYTKAEVQQLIDAVKQFTYEVVTTLPTASSDTMHKIYLVPSTNPQQQNVKDEYITILDGETYKWEQIGSTAIDLSGYYTSAQTDTAISNALNVALASYYTKSQIDTMVQTINQAIAAKYTKPSGGIPSSDMSSAVQTSLQKAENAAPQSNTYTKEQVDAMIADFITKSVDDLVNYYLKSEVYTQSEVQQLIAAVSQFRYQLAQTLPTASADTMGIIYLVPSTNPKTQNVKDEYITIDNGAEAQTRYTWEQIGSTAIDLSDYYTSTQTDTAITNALNAALASYYTKSQIDTMVHTINQAIAAKYTKPSGGIPSSDMSSAVQTSLQKAEDAAPQSTTYTKQEVNQLIAPKVNEAQAKTWAQLKQLRDDSELMPGQWYRITDYVTTVNTFMYDQIRSAGHAFDIMVMALTPSTLCETAFAIQHAGDTYFSGSRLQAWKLKYNIDNVDWSAQNGTYAADNNGYRFRKEGTIDIGGVTYTLWKGNQAYFDDWDWYAVSLNEEVGTDMLRYYPDTDPENLDVTGQIESVTTSTVNGKGTILSMCDEHNVEHTYDFKNIQFKRWKVTDDLNRNSINGKYLGIVNYLQNHITIEDETDFIWAYTYAVYDYNEATGDTTDNSLSGNVENVTSTVPVNNNVVCVWDTENTYTVYRLSITGGVSYITFSGDVYNNTFSGEVYNNTFSGYVESCTFSGYVANNTFSGNVQRCTFSGNVGNNTFSGDVYNNTFSGEVYNNTFSGSVYDCTFSGYVANNTFSGYVNNNTFSGNVQRCTFSGNLSVSMITGQLINNTITASGSNTGTMKNIYTYGYIANQTFTVPNSSNMPTYVAMNTSNVLKVWNPADLVS